MALLADAPDPLSRLRWLELADAGPRCCDPTPAAGCGDAAGHCAEALPARDQALALCRDADADAATRLQACILALDWSRRALAVRSALPAYDERCLPAVTDPKAAATAIAAQRQAGPIDPAAVPNRPGHVPPRPRLDDDVGRWVAAVDAYAAIARDEHREDAETALLEVARVLYAVSYVDATGTDRGDSDGAGRCARGRIAQPGEGLAGLVWDARRRLTALERAASAAVVAEALALGCRAAAADGERGEVQRRADAGRCPP